MNNCQQNLQKCLLLQLEFGIFSELRKLTCEVGRNRIHVFAVFAGYLVHLKVLNIL